WVIIRHAREFSAYTVSISPLYLGLSVGCCALGYLANLTVWIRLAAAFGIREDFITTGKAWLLSRMGRHVPGKVTILLVRFNQYKNHPNNAITAATITEHISSTAASGLIVTLAVTWGTVSVPHGLKVISALISLAMLLSLTPRIMPVLLRIAFRLARKEPPEKYPPYGMVLRFVGAYGVPALFTGASFFFLIKALYFVEWEHFLVIAGVYYGATLVGMAALFAPAGIGVREGVIYLILPVLIPEPVVIVAALGMRLIDTCTEASLGGGFWLLHWAFKRKIIQFPK
ncbi:MAG: hypothetical protein JEZ02_19770, partial [Desulfatibacillum sp.]|nr:hypothetical protein [Desulfatibacillum sp.]